MRQLALLGLVLALSGCGALENDYASSPLDGAGGFIVETHTIYRNPNRPVSEAANVQRAIGMKPASPPLLAEEGNVWPGPLPPSLTMMDIANTPVDPNFGTPHAIRTP